MRSVAGHRVRPGVAVAGARVEVEQEQIRDERGVEPLDHATRCSSSTGTTPASSACATVVARTASRVPVSHACRVPSPRIRQRGAFPEVEHRVHAVGRVERRVEHAVDLAAEQREVGDRPQEARVDLAARAAGPPTDLLGRACAASMRAHHLGIAQVRLGARDDDVCGHRDERRLERGAFRGERPADRAVVGDELVRRRFCSSVIVVAHGTHDRLGARAVELDLGAVGRLGLVEHAAHHARHLELAAHDADVAARRAARADDPGELVVDRREERGAGVADQRDDALAPRVHQLEHVVRPVEHLPPPAHRRRVEHLRSSTDVRMGGEDNVTRRCLAISSPEWLDGGASGPRSTRARRCARRRASTRGAARRDRRRGRRRRRTTCASTTTACRSSRRSAATPTVVFTEDYAHRGRHRPRRAVARRARS